MELINGLTNYPNQTQILSLPNGNTISLTMHFVQMQYGWFITNLTYGGFILNGLRITISPNLLLQWRNIIPFGLACYSTANREPSQLNDFSSGASQLYILSQLECEEFYRYLQTGIE